MERFLSQCAKYILNKYTEDLQDICIVLPNHRAGVFFTSYLRDNLSSPKIGPEVTTINNLFAQYSTFQQTERLFLVAELYSVFCKITGSTETFDAFYFWGETLLSDFNDIDNYLVNAKDLFTNIVDLKEIESHFDYLTPDQKETLEQFWGAIPFSGKNEFHRNYLSIWEKLNPVYEEFKKNLFTKKTGYPGMIDRLFVENLIDTGATFNRKKYCFIGLNALNNCEKELLSYLFKSGKAEFFWDYDVFYTLEPTNEAGWFIRENTKKFPMPADFYFKNDYFSCQKNISIKAISSLHGQAQAIPGFIQEINADFEARFDNTAIVLADESLLYPVLGAIPESIEKINVTMGYPVNNSAVYGFLLLIINMLRNRKKDKNENIIIYHQYVTDILNHQLLTGIAGEQKNNYIENLKINNRVVIQPDEIDFSSIHKAIFSLPDKIDNFCDYFLEILDCLYVEVIKNHQNNIFSEMVSSLYQALEKLKAVLSQLQSTINPVVGESVFFRLFNQYAGKLSVSFEGEPLSGIQVMGILETRCLDFNNLIIIGLNENNWPRNFTSPSFIPHSIRNAFGLPVIDHQDSMYGYYFYRLIQRAKNITITYNVAKEGISTGELSRYGFQLLYSSCHKPKLTSLDFCFSGPQKNTIRIKSSKEITQILKAANSKDKPLSPSAINMFIGCSLRFYFRYIMKLPEPEKLKEEVDGQVFGTVFHEAIEMIYRPFIGKTMEENDFDVLIKNPEIIEKALILSLQKNYFKNTKRNFDSSELEGMTLLIYENAKIYLKKTIETDKQYAPLLINYLEKKVMIPVTVKAVTNEEIIYIGGIIDRVDYCRGKTRILDYKTGNIDSLSFTSVYELFDFQAKKHKKEILQALLYTFIFKLTQKNGFNYQPVIYSLRKLFADDYNPEIKKERNELTFDDIESELSESLKNMVAAIFSPETVFIQTNDFEKCKYCPYNAICQRI